MQLPLVRQLALRQSRVERRSPFEGVPGRSASQKDPTERQCGGLTSAGLFPPPTSRASTCLFLQSNKRLPDASKLLPQVLIPEFGRRNSSSAAGQPRSDGFRRDREQQSTLTSVPNAKRQPLCQKARFQHTGSPAATRLSRKPKETRNRAPKIIKDESTVSPVVRQFVVVASPRHSRTKQTPGRARHA